MTVSDSTVTALNGPDTEESGWPGYRNTGCTRTESPPSRRSAVPISFRPRPISRARAQVVGLQVLDALVAHVVEVHRRAEREAREDRHLRRRVPAADVVGGVGLGVAAALGLGERLA